MVFGEAKHDGEPCIRRVVVAPDASGRVCNLQLTAPDVLRRLHTQCWTSPYWLEAFRRARRADLDSASQQRAGEPNGRRCVEKPSRRAVPAGTNPKHVVALGVSRVHEPVALSPGLDSWRAAASIRHPEFFEDTQYQLWLAAGSRHPTFQALRRTREAREAEEKVSVMKDAVMASLGLPPQLHVRIGSPEQGSTEKARAHALA